MRVRACLVVLLAACSGSMDSGPGAAGGAAGSDTSSGGRSSDSNQGGDEGGEAGNTGAGGDEASGGAPGNAGGNAGSGDGQGGAPNMNMGGTASGGSAGEPPNNNGGAPATGGTGAPTSDDCNGAAVCDDFEGESVGSRPNNGWRRFEIGNGDVEIDDARAYSGNRSVKITINPGGDKRARMWHDGGGLLPADKIFMRMMVYMEEAPSGQSPFHWSWMRVEGNVTAKSGGALHDVDVSVGGDSSGNNKAGYGGGANGGYQDCFAAGGNALPTGRWTCVEFQSDATTDTALTWFDNTLDPFTQILNGMAIPGRSGCLPGHDYTNNRWLLPRAEEIAFGWSMVHTLNGRATMWIDDVAVSDERIGCPGN